MSTIEKTPSRGRPIGRERARELSLMRKTFGGGPRRKTDVARCACGLMTLKRALTRGHDCGGKS